MIIINASVEPITPYNEKAVLSRIEQAGRVCYQSSPKDDDCSGAFVRRLIASGHESVIEHAVFTVKFTVDRGVSHEIVRHRIASYSQESTRYCNYGKEKFDGEITVIKPCFLKIASPEYKSWRELCYESERAYLELLKSCKPEEARCVLPTSLKTTLIMTANMREWRHFLKLRTANNAHPQMREVAVPLLEDFSKNMPCIFGDIMEEYNARKN